MIRDKINKLLWLLPPLLMMLNQRAGARALDPYSVDIFNAHTISMTQNSVDLMSDLFTEEDRSETDKCLLYKDIARYYQTALKADEYHCSESFLLFGPEGKQNYNLQRAQADSLKVASFNLYHLGNKLSAYKNYFQLAKMIDQWDVMGAIELKTLAKSSPLHKHNEKVREKLHAIDKKIIAASNSRSTIRQRRLIKRLKRSRLAIANRVVFPGYLQLLTRLRALDPSWSLIMTPEGEGRGTHMELTGIYFRSSRVHLNKSALCKGKLGCALKIEDGMDNIFVSRRPFIAGFVAGDLDFQYLVTHTKFNQLPQGDEASGTPNLLEMARDRMKEIVPGGDDEIEGIGKLYVGRYTEVAIILHEIKKIQQSTPAEEFGKLIMAGDFNIHVSGKYGELWDKVLDILSPDFQIYIESKTSISHQEGLSEDYDHFIAHKSIEKVCDIGEHKTNPDKFVFDFTKFKSPEYVDTIIRLHRTTRVAERSKRLKAEYLIAKVYKETHEMNLSQFKTYLDDQNNNRINSKDTVTFYGIPYDAFADIKAVDEETPLLPESDLNFYIAEMHDRVLAPDKTSPGEAYSPFIYLFSDHIPISMSCQTNL